MSRQKSINLARLLVRAYGQDSLSYFSLSKKKKCFFSSTGKSFIAYSIFYNVVLVSGSPIGAKQDLPSLIKEFLYFVKGMGKTACFLGVRLEAFDVLEKLQYRKIHIGDEAVLDIGSFEKKALKKKVRRAERHMNNLGVLCEIYNSNKLPEVYRKQLYTISKEWLTNKGRKERGFSMTLGRDPSVLDKECQFVIAKKNKKVLGYLTFVPGNKSQSFSLDYSRRIKNAPNGLTEFLLIKAFENYKSQNIKKVSLNFAAFNSNIHELKITPYGIAKAFIYKILRNIYRTNRLYSFNEKFKPNWEKRYLVFEKKRYFPLYLLALTQAELI